MNWTGTIAKRSLVAVFVAVMASALPSSASAQLFGLCGYCANHPDFMVQLHRFNINTYTNRMCDNVGGCHYILWGTGYCWDAHFLCLTFADTLDDLESAMAQADHEAFADALASSTDWVYDPAKGVLSFKSSCSQYIVARYVLPESFSDMALDMAVAMTAKTSYRHALAERVEHGEGR